MKSKKNKFPKIYRFIPAFAKASAGKPDLIWRYLPKFSRGRAFNVYRKTLKAFTIFIFIIVIIYLGLDLYKNIAEKKRVDVKRERITKELNFWKSFIEEHQDYRDAYLQLAILEYRLRDFEKARFYLNKSLAIDPNFEKGRKMEKILGH